MLGSALFHRRTTSDLEGLVRELGLPRDKARAGWLLVAAHPDDETVGATWLLRRAQEIEIVHVTDGTPHDRRLWSPRAPTNPQDYAALRIAEARAALELAGVSAARIHRLGFIDQKVSLGLSELARSLYLRFVASRPAVVIVHPYEGGHPDHDATAFAVHTAAELVRASQAEPPVLVEMTSYHRAEGRLATGRFLPAPSPIAKRTLTAADQRSKTAMLAAFPSQAEVLAPFDLSSESYRLAPSYDFTAAPHPGPLHYEALGWMRGETFRARALAALVALGLARPRAPAPELGPCQ
jgi:N-acetylglucosamine malate deacetylase 2